MVRLSSDYAPDELAHIIDICMKALRFKDAYTFAHSERVGKLAQEISSHLSLTGEEINASISLGRLHDIGKLFVPNSILQKPASLNEAEWESMRRHSVDAVRILSCMNFMEQYMDVIKALHERFDGKGYPDGIEGEQIPALARILAVADSYDAMTTDRPYRKAQPLEYVRAELVRERSRQFCPQVVDVVLDMLEKKMKKPYAVVTVSIKKLFEVAPSSVPAPALARVFRAA